MYRSCVDPALVALKRVLDRPHYAAHLQTLILSMDRDLKFFKMFFWGLAYLEDSLQDWRFRGAWSTMMANFMQTAEDFTMQLEYAEKKITSWEALSGPLRRLMTQYKAQVKEICPQLLKGEFAYRDCEPDKGSLLDYGEDTLCFIGLVLHNVGALDLDSDVIQRRLRVFGMFARVTKDSPDVVVAAKVVSHVQTWAVHVACLVCLFWVDGDNDVEDTRGAMFADLMGRYMPYTPEVISIYLELLKGSRYYDFQSSVITQLLVSYVDFLLENLVLIGENDVELLHQGMIFLLSFVMDPIKEDSEERESILARINDILSEFPLVISTPQRKLLYFLNMIDKVKLQVRELYVLKPLEFPFNSSKTNAVGFLDCFVANLKKMLEGKVDFLPFVKHQVEMVHEQLTLIRPFLQNVEIQSEHDSLYDLWTRVVDVVYYAEYCMMMCPMASRSVWYGIICLPDVIQDMKFVRSEVEKIESTRIYRAERLPSEMESTPSKSLLSEARNSNDEVPFICYKQETNEILNHLVGGTKSLTILSISGMSGQGKTTLATRVYDHSLVRGHFHTTAWCFVSQQCSREKLLANILRQVSTSDYGWFDYHDQAIMLRKTLKGRRYLIVLDDIMSVDVWHHLFLSFPDDWNGSRILFTCRNHDLAWQVGPNSIRYLLRCLSDEESWDLLKGYIFNFDDVVPHTQELLEIGKKMASYCRGLPLTICIVGSLLRAVQPALDLWEQIAGFLLSPSHSTCQMAMELSYKLLPDHLKPCILYLVAFGRDQNICAKKLKLLWIAEGFVEENGKQSSDDLAKEYLDSLVYRNLVVGVERSSRGQIKSCRFHDNRFYDFCFEKVVHDQFLGTQEYESHHRLCIHESGMFLLPESAHYRKELPTSQIHTLLWYSYDSEEKLNLSLFLSSFRVLTVLDLEIVHLTNFPELILYNIYLRYLALRGDIKDIPQSIGDLWNLETIIIRSTGAVGIPDILWEMESMKYVYVHGIHLNSQDLWTNKFPMASACNIEALGDIILKYDSKTKEFLRRLSRLRKLKSGCDVEVIHPMWLSLFGSLLKLESLHLYYAGGGGFLPNRKLPTIDFPDNLRKLTLTSFKLPWSVMSTIGRLSNLKVLKLLCAACVGTTWYLGDEEFSRLTYLKLYKMDVERIDDSACDNPFPCLEKLFLLNCSKLVEIPSSFGDICTLDTIDISLSHPQVSESARNILEQQREMGNDYLKLTTTPYVDVSEVAIPRKQHGSHSGKSRTTQNHDDADGGGNVLEEKNLDFSSSIYGNAAWWEKTYLR